eukprot:gene4253-14366_t
MRKVADTDDPYLRSSERKAKGAVLSAIEQQIMSLKTSHHIEEHVETHVEHQVVLHSLVDQSASESAGPRRSVGRSISFGRQGYQVAAAVRSSVESCVSKALVVMNNVDDHIPIRLQLEVSEQGQEQEIQALRDEFSYALATRVVVDCGPTPELKISALQKEVAVAHALRFELCEQLDGARRLIQTCFQRMFENSIPLPVVPSSHQACILGALCYPTEGQPDANTDPMEGQPDSNTVPMEGQPDSSTVPIEGQQDATSEQPRDGEGSQEAEPHVSAEGKGYVERLELEWDCLWFGQALALKA